MAPAPDDPAEKCTPDVRLPSPPNALVDAVSRIQRGVAPSLIQQLESITNSTRELQMRITSMTAPFQAIRDAQSAFSSLPQGQLDKITGAVRAVQKDIEALTGGPYKARIDVMVTPYQAVMTYASQFLGPIKEFQALWEEKIGPLQKLSSQLAAIIAPYQGIAESFRRSLGSPEMREWIERLRLHTRVRVALDRVGWLSHPTIPDKIILEALDSEGEEAVSGSVEQYLQANWESVAVVFRERFRRSGADEETLASMDEALQCRANGLHRATCRAIFPEIERTVRLRMPPPDPTKMASLVELRETIAGLPVNTFDLPGLLWMSVFEHVQDACYAKVGAHVTKDDFPLPNRHAVAHGRLPYSTPRDSMNSLVIADFLLTCVGSVVAHLPSADRPSEE